MATAVTLPSMLKAECDSCGMVVRTTRKWIEEVGLPTCACGGQFEQDGGYK